VRQLVIEVLHIIDARCNHELYKPGLLPIKTVTLYMSSF